MATPSLGPVQPVLPLVIDPQQPTTPELHRIAKDALDRMKLAFLAAAATDGGTPGRADKVVGRFIASRRPEAKAKYQQRSRDLMTAAPGVRAAVLGRYGTPSLDEYLRTGSDAVSKLVPSLPIDAMGLRRAVEFHRANDARVWRLAPTSFSGASQGKKRPRIHLNPEFLDQAAGAKYKKVGLFLHSVHCIEESNELSDSDEISIGGNSIAADGATSVITPFMISDDFDAGEKVGFGAGRTFAEYPLLTDAGSFPRVYTTIVAIAEKDDGGFYKFLKELWDLVDEKVKTAIGGAIGAAIGGAIGNVAGAIVGFVVGALIGWIVSLFDNPDDIVGLKTLQLWLGAATESYYQWAGLTGAPPKSFPLNFTGDGAHYRVWMYYNVHP